MRYFIFCSLFFIVFAEKGPRLKFVVHGRFVAKHSKDELTYNHFQLLIISYIFAEFVLTVRYYLWLPLLYDDDNEGAKTLFIIYFLTVFLCIYFRRKSAFGYLGKILIARGKEPLL